LTIVNCIGFLITIFSILVISNLLDIYHSPWVFLVLAVGPLAGIIALRNNGTT